HKDDSGNEKAASFALTSDNSYQNLLEFADKDLEKLAFERDVSVVGDCVAGDSKLFALLTERAAALRTPPEIVANAGRVNRERISWLTR
ncbi:MAG: hypothetical protein ACYSYM_11600, partial [Planctomycetota bacterium]